MTRSYATPEAFRQALEQRLRSATLDGVALGRRRQLLVFERFLARVAARWGPAATLKGGLVLEIRLQQARATKDVDLRLAGRPQDALQQLQEAARHDLGDFMAFEITLDHDQPEILNAGMAYGGLRFRARCTIAGKLYGHPFGVDVAFGGPILGEPETAVGHDLLDFAGIAPPTLRLYPIETHIAEKLHAYTTPRPHPNTRVKDLPDIALLASIRPLDGARLRAAIEQTFEFRKAELPLAFPDPPEAWTEWYAAMARDNRLPWPTIDSALQAVRAFLDPVLRGDTLGVWAPKTWSWPVA